ncbi:hypothetical protein MRN59_07140 [Macrococcoides caseolyticum]|uniref:lipopolysaccharide biosynthesis protein n=1 Tax=Macrococcoides caseolyticum TaxID=69966 RepID=UPI00339D5F41
MKKNKDFFNKILISISTLFYSLSNFVFVYLLTRNMLPEEYGKLNSILIYGTLISLVLINGVDQVIMRYYYTKNIKIILKNYFYIFTSLNIILIIIIYVIYSFTNHNYLLLLVYSNFLTIFRIFNIIIRMNGNSLNYAFYNIFSKLIELLLVLIFIYYNTLNYKFAIYSYILSIIIATIILLYFINLDNGVDYSSFLSFKYQISYAIPMFIAVLVTTLSQNIDKILLPLFVSTYKVGIYFSAFKLTSALMIIQSIFSLIWIPNIIKKYENNESINLNKIFNDLQAIITVLVVIFLLINNQIVKFLGEEFIESKTILPILILVPCLLLLSEIGSIGISLKEKSKIHMLNSLIYLFSSGLLTIFLSQTQNLLLISIGIVFSTYIFYLARTYIGTYLLNIKINFIKIEFINFTLFIIIFLKVFNYNYAYICSSIFIIFVVIITTLRRYL